MWIFDFLPNWIAYIITLAGLVGIVVSLLSGVLSRIFPQLAAIKIPLQLISIIVMAFGSYLTGGIANHDMWLAKVKEMEQNVKIAEQKAKDTSAKIEFKYIDRVKVVKDVQVVVQERIKEVEKIIDAKCEVPSEAIELLNMAAASAPPSTAKHQDVQQSLSLKNSKAPSL